jgi:hypothetical protein
MKGVEQRAQVRVDLGFDVAGQIAEFLTGLDCRAHQHHLAHAVALEEVHRRGHREIGLACARWSDAEDQIVVADGVEIRLLVERARLDAPARRVDIQFAAPPFGVFTLGRQRHGTQTGPQRLLGDRVQHLLARHALAGAHAGQHRPCDTHGLRLAAEPDHIIARGHRDPQRFADHFQVTVRGAEHAHAVSPARHSHSHFHAGYAPGISPENPNPITNQTKSR